MVETKKFLDLNGLGYAIRKINNKKADLESPDFTGTPTAPTPPIGDKTNTLATTEYVQKEFNKTVRWDNAEEGTTISVTNNMVVLTEEEYESLTTKMPNTFYFIYDNEGVAVSDL